MVTDIRKRNRRNAEEHTELIVEKCMKRKSWIILLIAVLSIVFALGFAGLCEYLFTRNRPKPLSEAEIKNMFIENRSDLNRCAELLYSKPDFWRRMDDTRTYNWSLRLDVDFYSEFYSEEEWSAIKSLVKKLNPIQVAYYISLMDHVTSHIEFIFPSSESTNEETLSIKLCYIPTENHGDTEKQQIIDHEPFRQVRISRLDNDWYCKTDMGLDEEKMRQS